jgi:hypothetical protein
VQLINALWRRIPLRWQVRLGGALAALFLRSVDASLNRFGYQRTCRWLLRFSPAPPPDRADPRRASAVAAVFLRAADRRQPPYNCLRHSLAIWWMLRWLRLPSQLRMAVSRDQGHAWVEHHGLVLNDSLDVAQRYALIYDERMSPEGIVQWNKGKTQS